MPETTSRASRDYVVYKRSRFSTRLPFGRLYTASHFWIQLEDDDLCRVGFTKFATRMLGDLVEYGFEVQPGDPIRVGQIIGWVEGFKAATDLFGVIEGTFEGENNGLEKNIGWLRSDPYGKGWLYRARGSVEPNAVSVEGYVGVLDTTIDRIQGKAE